MTKCIVLGQEPKEVKKNPIEFIKVFSAGIKESSATNTEASPLSYDFIELVCKSFDKQGYFDIMFAYNKNERSTGSIFLGHWNDGVV